MTHTLDHQNNVSIAFPMSENLGIDTFVIIIPAILTKIDLYIGILVVQILLKKDVPGTT